LNIEKIAIFVPFYNHSHGQISIPEAKEASPKPSLITEMEMLTEAKEILNFY